MSEKYFDNAVATEPSKRALAAMREAEPLWQCLSAPYSRMQNLRPFVEGKYAQLRAILGFRESDICIFTSSSSEAIAHVLSGVYRETIQGTGKNQILYLSIDEASIVLGLEAYRPFHVSPKSISLKETGGLLTKELLKAHITPRTALVSLSWAHGITGCIQPLVELADLCEEEGVLLHVDATSVFGKLHFQYKDLPVDYLTIDGSRVNAPYGTGLLLIKRGSTIPSLIPDAVQQNGVRGGIFPLPGFSGFVEALTEGDESGDFISIELTRLRDIFEGLITKEIPDVSPLFTTVERLPGVSVLLFPGIKGEHLQHALAFQGCYASRGGGIHQVLEDVLVDVGIERIKAASALSFSFGRDTSEALIREAAHLVIDTYRRLAKGGIVL